MTVGKKLAAARTKISITKTGTNSFAKYSYYQIDVIYAEAKAIFNEVGITTVERVDIFEVCGQPYMKFFLDVINVDDMNDKITFEAITEPNTMKGAQAAQEAGSTITYMTKYLYGLALMIDDGKADPDATNDHKEDDGGRRETTPAPILDKRQKAINCITKIVTERKMHVNLEGLKDMTEEELKEMYQKMMEGK